MTKKIFKSSILASVIVLIIGMACVLGVLYRHFGGQIINELKKEAEYLSYGVELKGKDYLENVNEQDSRITYIDDAGNVLYDSMADEEAMENHKDREEFLEAEETGVGQAERISDTLSERTLYYAVRLSDNSVLRVSSTQDSVLALTVQLIPPALGILAVLIILACFFASRIASRIVEPLNSLDLEHPEENMVYEEVAPLLSKIHKQNGQIRLQIEEARRNQEEFRIITENMQEGLLVIDAYTMILSGNSSVWKMFQVWEPKIGESVYSLDRTEDFRKVIEKVLKGEHGSALLHVDNEFIHLIANPVTRDGSIVGAVLVLMNETEKVQRESLRREFSANVSHELKTPLTSISGYAEIIQGGLVRDEDIRGFAGRIYKEAQRLIQLVEDTIKISQLDEGANPYEWEDVDIYQLSKEVCGNLKDVAYKKNVHLFIEGKEVYCRAVRPILEEVLYNLCDNGIKYNRDDGTVSIHIEEEEENVRIVVKDTGIGIPREDISRVFERFYRVDKSHSREIGGTGLGLSIVKHGVTFLGGTVDMISELGKGTEITVILPKSGKTE